MKQVKYVILSLCVIFCMCTLAHADETTEISSPKPIEIAFPLPWRSQRLIADAMNPQTSLSNIRVMLKDKDSSVQLEAVRTLGERGSQNDLPELDKLADEKDNISAAAKVASVWIKARMRLGEDEVEEITKFLISANSREQLEAVLALGQIDTPLSTQKLADYLEMTNVSPYNTLRALVFICKRDSPQKQSSIEKFFSEKPPIKSLVKGLGREHIGDSIDVKLAQEYWKSRLDDISPQQKIAVFTKRFKADLLHLGSGSVPLYGMEEALANSGTNIVPLLNEVVLDSDTDIYIKQSAIVILKLIPDKLALDTLIELYSNHSVTPKLRESIQKIIAEKGDTKTLSMFLQKLQTGVGQAVQGNSADLSIIDAMWTLYYAAKNGVVDNDLVEQAVLPYIKLADWEKGSYLAALIDRRVGGTESAEPLINLIEHGKIPDDQVAVLHNSSITTLGYVGSRVTDSKVRTKVLFFLIHQCYDKDPVTRIVAVQALARMAGAEGIPVMGQMAKKEKDGAAMRFEISGIYKAGGPDAVTALNDLRKFAIDNQNAQMQELCEEGLLRLKREGRDKEVKPVTYPGDSGGLFE